MSDINPVCDDRPRSAAAQRRARLAAVLAGILLLTGVEAFLHLTGAGEPGPEDDPFVGFAAIHPLFTRTDDGTRYQTAPQRRGFFAEDSFLSRKPPGGQRIFVLGGSTVQGRPFSIPTSFTHCLETGLNALTPSVTWEVVNCGGISYASYRLVPILNECLMYEPDLVIICTGHNEFLEDVAYRSAGGRRPDWVSRSFSALQHLRTFRLLHRTLQGSLQTRDEANPRPVLSDEVDATLDHRGGLAAFHRDPQHAADVTAHFRSNTSRMVRILKRAGVPVLLIRPPTNLSDSPPFKSEFLPNTSPADRQRVLDALLQASEISRADPAQAIRLLRNATELDAGYALTWYQLGNLLQSQGAANEAADAFAKAVDEDVCPLRMTSALDAALRDVAEELNVSMLDAHAIMARDSRDGIVGGYRLVDHVHPSFRGHQDIAAEILRWMESAHIISALPGDWETTCRSLWRQTIQELDDLYFLRGQRALADLKSWAAGRGQKPPRVQTPTAEHRPPAQRRDDPIRE